MTDLLHSLRRCHARDGWIGVVKRAEDQYELTLYKRDDALIERVPLTYDGFQRAYRYWQKVGAPLLPGPYRHSMP
jgi:hypothetical protein